jgi:hypothetical protein
MNRPVQYRLLAAIKRQPWRRKLAPLLLLSLAGCATANMDCTDLRQGACKLSFMRLATDTSATLTGPDGFSLSYSSNPQAEATAQAFAAINRLAGLVARQQPPAEDEADGVAWRPAPKESFAVPIANPGDHISRYKKLSGDSHLADTPTNARYNEMPARLSVPESCPAPPQWTMQRVTV